MEFTVKHCIAKSNKFTYKINSVDDDMLSINQIKNIDIVMDNLEKIIDLKKVEYYLYKYKIKELIIFGSRTRLHERENSDLDIMVLSYEKEISEDNYVEEQRQYLKNLYMGFVEIVKDTSIVLDFKLNLFDDYDNYGGLTYNADFSDNGVECDFIFETSDLPSYVSFTKDEIKFVLEKNAIDIFDGNKFKKVV
ncbi:MAG: hypothetical protein K0R54_539 [Clostridiaceae bacterium]|jgi:predicted nucleotidyltransferase|nr:hypothetical protein [Clostridiaceae bacterium]